MDEYMTKGVRGMAADGWHNVATGMGVYGTDKRMSNILCRKHLAPAERDELYHGDDIMKRACDIVPEEMTREWADFPSDSDGWLATRLDSLGAREKFTDALVWERKDGGAGIYLGAFDGLPVSAPLDEEKVSRRSVYHFAAASELVAAKWYTDPKSPKYGEVSHYWISTYSHSPSPPSGKVGEPIHESRFLLFKGARTSRRVRFEYGDWGVPLPDLILDVVRDFTTSYSHAATIVTDFSQAVYSMQGLVAALNADLDGVVLQRMKLMDFTRSMSRAIVLDAEHEKFERTGTPVSGLEDLLDHLGLRLAASLGIPLTLLLGMSPGGLNATGDSDHRNFYNSIKAQQTTRLAPPLRRLCRLLVTAAKKRKIIDSSTGEVPFTFRSLWQPSDLEIAKSRWDMAQADEKYISLGVASRDEVRASRFGGARYSFDTLVKGPAPEPQPPAVAPAGSDAASSGAPGGSPATSAKKKPKTPSGPAK